MKIGVLTATITEADFFPNIIELKSLAQKRGHEVVLFKNGEFNLFVDHQKTIVYYQNQEIDLGCFDVVLNRLSVRDKSNADYYIVEEFINKGVKIFNTPEAIFKARNKLLTLQLLSTMNIPLTKSFVVRRFEDLAFCQNHFTFPVIIKNIFGSLGSSTLLAYDYKQLKSLFDYIWNLNRNEVLLIQEFIKDEYNETSDYRAFLLGHEVVLAMKRKNSSDDFRANYKKGADVFHTTLTDQEKEMCSRISRKFGLEICGVDFMRTKAGPVVLEVNSNPGLDGIRKAGSQKGFDILELIIDYCEKLI